LPGFPFSASLYLNDGREEHAACSGEIRAGGVFYFPEVKDLSVDREFDSAFEIAYQNWLEYHVRVSGGDRKRRLAKGLGYAEKLFLSRIWWPSFMNLQNLHPEFEVRDFKDGIRYLDFAYLMNDVRVCFEIDAYGTHLSNVDRWQFADHLIRQNHLIIDGWKVLRFSVDDLKDRSRQCQQVIQQAFGKWNLERNQSLNAGHPIQNAILRLMRQRHTALSPQEGARELGWHRITVSAHMKDLLVQGFLLPSKPGMKRIRRYRLNPNRLDSKRE
jgi:very-short-patch-repair endonuclease